MLSAQGWSGRQSRTLLVCYGRAHLAGASPLCTACPNFYLHFPRVDTSTNFVYMEYIPWIILEILEYFRIGSGIYSPNIPSFLPKFHSVLTKMIVSFVTKGMEYITISGIFEVL